MTEEVKSVVIIIGQAPDSQSLAIAFDAWHHRSQLSLPPAITLNNIAI